MTSDDADILKTKLLGLVAPARGARVTGLNGGSIALGIGRRGPGPNDFVVAVRIQDHSPAITKAVHDIKKEVHSFGGEVDIKYIGRVAKWTALSPDTKRTRPLSIGAYLAYETSEGGNLACFLKDDMGQVYLLSNNHVLADENDTQGLGVYQPPVLSGGKPKSDEVARLSWFVPLRPQNGATAGAPTVTNQVDAAIAAVDAGLTYDAVTIPKLGSLVDPTLAPVSAVPDVNVAKYGTFSGLSFGKVKSWSVDNLTVWGYYGLGPLVFDHQIEIVGEGTARFAKPGDSGSLVVAISDKPNLYPVGILFGGTTRPDKDGDICTYANPFDTVLSQLNNQPGVAGLNLSLCLKSTAQKGKKHGHHHGPVHPNGP